MLDDACAHCDFSNNDDETGNCLPGDSLVVLKGGLEKRMDHLSIGDVVMTLKNDKLETTEILGFLDKKKNSTGKYLNLIAEDGYWIFYCQGDHCLVQDWSLCPPHLCWHPSCGRSSGFQLHKCGPLPRSQARHSRQVVAISVAGQ